jgi:hypothetical protein
MEPTVPRTTLAAQTLAENPSLREAATRDEGIEHARAAARRTTVDGQVLYVLEGDLLYDEDEFALHQLQNSAGKLARMTGAVPPSILNREDGLVVVTASQKIVRWAPGSVLSYAVLKKSFPSEETYKTTRDNVALATRAWAEVCGVEWQHMSRHDDHEDTAASADDIDEDLKFVVRYVDAGGEFIAAAFFPTYPPARRKVLIDPSYFDATLRFDKVGVLRHELGHVLGFRHEHIRSEAPAVCPDESRADTFDLTAYDPRSVMHYFCGGVGTNELAITEVDQVGAQKVYGLPFSQLQLIV